MVQRGQSLGLALEARHVLGVVGERGRKNFDGDVAIETRVAGAPDLSHAALAELGNNAVRADGGVWGHAAGEGMVPPESRSGNAAAEFVEEVEQ